MPLNAATRHGLWLFATGLGLGWLIGMSQAPVIQGVITALVTFVVGVAGVVVGLRSSQAVAAGGPAATQIEPSIMASLVLGLALGSALGILTRTHNLLGGDRDQSTNARPHPGPTPDAGPAGATAGVLFAGVAPAECDRLRAAPDDQLERVMASSTDERVRTYARKYSGRPDSLRALVSEVLCPDTRK